MPKRIEVYAAIDGQIEHEEDSIRDQCLTRGIEYTPNFNKTTEMYLSYITAMNIDLLGNVSMFKANLNDTLSIFRMLAAQCVSCMEFNGGCDRDLNTGDCGNFIEPILNRKRVYRMIDTERQYQEEAGLNKIGGDEPCIEGDVIRFQHWLHEAHIDWVDRPGDEYCLNTIRKLAGIAVHAMEEHGVVLQEPFNS